HTDGITSSNAFGTGSAAGCSYAPVAPLFAASCALSLQKGKYITASPFNIGNMPDGASNQVAIVERFASTPYYGAFNLPLVYSDWANFGWSSAGSYWGVGGGAMGINGTDVTTVINTLGQYTPQIAPGLKTSTASTPAANPLFPNTMHTTCQVLLMDGSVR